MGRTVSNAQRNPYKRLNSKWDYFKSYSSTPSATLASRVSSSSSNSSKRSYNKDTGVSLRDLSSPLSSSPPITSSAASEVRANLSELKQQMREFSGLTASTTASQASANETSYGRSLSYSGLGRKFSSPSLMLRQHSPIGIQIEHLFFKELTDGGEGSSELKLPFTLHDSSNHCTKSHSRTVYLFLFYFEPKMTHYVSWRFS